MSITIIGLFDTFSEAQNAVADLTRFGVHHEHISLIVREAYEATIRKREVGASDVAKSAGCIGGALVGGTFVSVGAADHEADDIRQILIRNGAIDLANRAIQ